MKITYIHQYFNTRSMPGSTRSLEMASRLVAKGHQVSVITSWREPIVRKHWFVTSETGITVHWLPILYSNRMSFQDRILSFLRFAVCSARRAASLDSDLIFATSTPLTVALPAVYASYSSGVPMVFEVRDLWPEMPIAMGVLTHPLQILASRALELWAYRNASSVVVLSPGMKKGVLRTGYSSKRIAVIPNGCDTSQFAYEPEAARNFRASRPWLGEKPLLLYAGTFGKVNGVGYAVDLASELLMLGSDVQLLLVGDGVEYEHVRQMASILGVLNRNLFLEPQIAKQEVKSLLSAATISSNLVIDLPEARANSANKFFDALAAGKPVFLNHGGWMHQLVIQHQCGIVAWRRPLQDVARELDRCLNDEDWLTSAGRSARKLAELYFERDFLATQFEKVLVASANGNPYLAETIAPGLY